MFGKGYTAIITTGAPTPIWLGDYVKGSCPRGRGTADHSKKLKFFEGFFSDRHLSRGKA